MIKHSCTQLGWAVVLLASSAFAQESMATPPPSPQLSVQAFSSADLAAKVPAPKADDVKTLDGIMRAAYEAISGPAGPRDWSRFRSLFLPQALFTEVGKERGPTFVVSGASMSLSTTRLLVSRRKVSTKTPS